MNETTKTTDPVQFTRERLAEIGNVWMDFAKMKLMPYVEKPQQWMKQKMETKANGASQTGGATPG